MIGKFTGVTYLYWAREWRTRVCILREENSDAGTGKSHAIQGGVRGISK